MLALGWTPAWRPLGLFWFVQGVTEGWHELRHSSAQSLDRPIRHGWDGPRVRGAE